MINEEGGSSSFMPYHDAKLSASRMILHFVYMDIILHSKMQILVYTLGAYFF